MTSDVMATHRPSTKLPHLNSVADGENFVLAETEKDAQKRTGGAHDAVGSSAVVALQDDNESRHNACTAVGLENVNAAQSSAMVKELSGRVLMTSEVARIKPVRARLVSRMSPSA
ncbi:hypothetical protein MRX96_028399 [Rhipicephalus microplus]